MKYPHLYLSFVFLLTAGHALGASEQPNYPRPLTEKALQRLQNLIEKPLGLIKSIGSHSVPTPLPDMAPTDSNEPLDALNQLTPTGAIPKNSVEPLLNDHLNQLQKPLIEKAILQPLTLQKDFITPLTKTQTPSFYVADNAWIEPFLILQFKDVQQQFLSKFFNHRSGLFDLNDLYQSSYFDMMPIEWVHPKGPQYGSLFGYFYQGQIQWLTDTLWINPSVLGTFALEKNITDYFAQFNPLLQQHQLKLIINTEPIITLLKTKFCDVNSFCNLNALAPPTLMLSSFVQIDPLFYSQHPKHHLVDAFKQQPWFYQLSASAQQTLPFVFLTQLPYLQDHFLIFVDKPKAKMLVLDAKGQLINQSKVLLGATVGDFYKGNTQMIDHRITPAGLFKLGLRDATRSPSEARTAGAYATKTVFVLDKALNYEYSVTLFHSLWLNDADAKARKQAIDNPNPSDARYSYGCINVEPHTYQSLLSYKDHMDGALLYIVPDNPQLTMEFLIGALAFNQSLLDELVRFTPSNSPDTLIYSFESRTSGIY